MLRSPHTPLPGGPAAVPALLLVALLAAGCAGFGLDPPEVGLVDVRFRDLTLFESSGTLTLRLSNPNRDPLAVTGGLFRLSLDGVRVGSALTGEGFEIPGLGTTTIEVPIHVSNVALATRLRRIFESRRVDWRLRSELHLPGTVGTRKLKAVHEGRLDLRAPAEAEGLGDADPLTDPGA